MLLSSVYVDFGRDDSDNVQLAFAFGADPDGSAIKVWDIKASQIRCGEEGS